jgi:hypothetical protein
MISGWDTGWDWLGLLANILADKTSGLDWMDISIDIHPLASMSSQPEI